MKHSHNDYWCKKPIFDALKADCIIFEIDIVWSYNDIYLSHSLRPFKSMMYGKLKSYLRNFKKDVIEKYPNKKYYLYIEFKSGNKKIISRLGELLTKYFNKDITILLSAKDNNCFSRKFQKRERCLKKFYDKYNVILTLIYMKTFKETTSIKRVDLFKSHWNHF